MEKKLYIYFKPDRKVTQVVSPTSQFDGNWKELADAVTRSNKDQKNYHSFEIR